METKLKNQKDVETELREGVLSHHPLSLECRFYVSTHPLFHFRASSLERCGSLSVGVLPWTSTHPPIFLLPSHGEVLVLAPNFRRFGNNVIGYRRQRCFVKASFVVLEHIVVDVVFVREVRICLEWHAKQIASREAKDNDNFTLPLREKIKRKRAQATKESGNKPQDAIKQNQQQLDLIKLAKGFPSNWQDIVAINLHRLKGHPHPYHHRHRFNHTQIFCFQPEINWSHFIRYRMTKALRPGAPLSYEFFVTQIMQHFQIPLDDEIPVSEKKFTIATDVIFSFGFKKNRDNQWRHKDDLVASQRHGAGRPQQQPINDLPTFVGDSFNTMNARFEQLELNMGDCFDTIDARVEHLEHDMQYLRRHFGLHGRSSS
ncbi:hypothetical protein V8G54_027725 [Vigna mungo]|uniref:Uncharacterized protein n=1 Tax=Vigna mungo TaxID=3915 RepID=A0AAQ3MQ58_VIGMU